MDAALDCLKLDVAVRVADRGGGKGAVARRGRGGGGPEGLSRDAGLIDAPRTSASARRASQATMADGNDMVDPVTPQLRALDALGDEAFETPCREA